MTPWITADVEATVTELVRDIYADAGVLARWTGMHPSDRRKVVLDVIAKAEQDMPARILVHRGMEVELNAARLIRNASPRSEPEPKREEPSSAETIAAAQARADALDHAAIERALAARWNATGAGIAWDTTARRAKDGLVSFAAYMLARTGEALARTERDGTRHLITLDDYEQHREQS